MNVIITGASRGLGFATAELFAANGHNLYLCSKNEVLLYRAVEELVGRFPNISVKAKPFDLGKRDNASAFGNWILGLGIPIDVLVNNAGLFVAGSIHDEKEGMLEKMIETNLYSAYYLSRILIPAMIRQQSGHIFNICSIGALQAYPNGGSYSISKFALAGFSKNLREEMKPHGIKVTTVYPGAAYTDSWANSGIDPKRLMKPSDVAAMIFSASQMSPQACVEEIILRPQLGDL